MIMIQYTISFKMRDHMTLFRDDQGHGGEGGGLIYWVSHTLVRNIRPISL